MNIPSVAHPVVDSSVKATLYTLRREIFWIPGFYLGGKLGHCRSFIPPHSFNVAMDDFYTLSRRPAIYIIKANLGTTYVWTLINLATE